MYCAEQFHGQRYRIDRQSGAPYRWAPYHQRRGKERECGGGTTHSSSFYLLDAARTQCSQSIILSEDRVEPNGGGYESGETVGDSVFLGLSEGTSSEKNLRDVSERIPEPKLVPLANDSVYGASGDLPETDPRDQSHQRSVSDICASTLTVRGDGDRGKRTFVTFNPVVTVHLIPAENRKSEWNQCAINRAHFQRRIQLFEELFTAL